MHIVNQRAEIPEPGDSLDLFIGGPAGRLEARLSMPAASANPEGAAVICHPHPSYGGTMDNKVAYTLARACNEAGLAALRFNFRGVGDSEGGFDEGRGEVDDCLAAVDWLRQTLPAARLVNAGFSFGAYVSFQAAASTEPVQLITVAPPMFYFGDNAPTAPPCPWLVVQGDADDVVEADSNLEALRAMQPVPDIRVLQGVGHFFHGQLTALKEIVVEVLEARWADL